MTYIVEKNWPYPNEHYESINNKHHQSITTLIPHPFCIQNNALLQPQNISHYLPPKPSLQMKPESPKLMPTQSPICQAPCSVNGPLP